MRGATYIYPALDEENNIYFETGGMDVMNNLKNM